ncbi:MAG: carboxymuconolactone decarboxylase family protein [Pseudomonadota bacterium]
MTDFQIHTKETAPADAEGVLDMAKQKYGRVPNLLAAMAEALVIAEAYMVLDDLLEKTSLSVPERHVAWFTINAEHGCDYCMAAHTGGALRDGVPEEVVEEARAVAPFTNPRLEALRQFTLQLVRQRGWVSDAEIAAFLDAGYTRRNVLELVTVVAQKVLSNYTNHIVGTPLDGAFEKHRWERLDDSDAA